MTFPIWYLLIPYAVFLFIACLFVLANIFHIVKFGLEGIKTAIVLFVYSVAFAGVLLLNAYAILNVDWEDDVTVDGFILTTDAIL